MSTTIKMLFVTLLTCFIFLPAFAGDPPFYLKKSGWHATMLASREAFAKQEAAVRATEKTMFGPWYMIGPFASVTRRPFFEVFPPEREIALNKRYADGALAWTQHPEWESGRAVELPHVSQSATYLYRTVLAHRDTTMVLYLGSDDGIQVWVDRTLVLQDSSERAVAPNQDTAQIHLKAGKNDLLLKISNGEGNYAFYFSLSPYTIDDLWDLLQRDFTSPDQIREMYWERQDGIWEKEWTTGDLTELAGRYAAAYQEVAEVPDPAIKNLAARVMTPADLQKVRELYLDARRGELASLIPVGVKESPSPRINGARVFGVRPGHPFMFRIAATGDRPMQFRADGLPAGLTLDTLTGIITGAMRDRGEYNVKLRAANASGSAERKLRIVVGDRIALTPPLGWNSWNCFASAVDDQKVRQAAEAMVKSGLINHGWTYINIDDCWSIDPTSHDPKTMGGPRDERGRVNTNKKFPDMKALSEYVHSLGLRMGIYSSPGPLTCAGY